MRAASFLDCRSNCADAKFRVYVTVDNQPTFDTKATVAERFTESVDPIAVVIEPINALDAVTFTAIGAFDAIDALAIETIFTINSIATVNVPTIDSFALFDAGFNNHKRRCIIK